MLNSELESIDPSAGRGNAQLTMAPRPQDLAGKTVVLLDNTKEQSDIIMQTVAAQLEARYGAARVIIRSKAHYSKPATDALIDELAREAHVAVAGLGG